MKESTAIIKKMDKAQKYMPMATCIQDNTIKIKNMEEALSFGLVSATAQLSNILTQRFSSMREHGGEGYPMEKDNTKKQMVFTI